MNKFTLTTAISFSQDNILFNGYYQDRKVVIKLKHDDAQLECKLTNYVKSYVNVPDIIINFTITNDEFIELVPNNLHREKNPLNVIIFEYIEGRDITQEDLIKPEIITDLCEIIDKIHKIGIIHNNISQYKFLLVGSEIYITDFGQAFNEKQITNKAYNKYLFSGDRTYISSKIDWIKLFVTCMIIGQRFDKIKVKVPEIMDRKVTENLIKSCLN